MKQKLLFFILGLLSTLIIVTGIRFALYEEKYTHFHANFAVFIDGKRINLSDNKYMEEISSCIDSAEVQPKQRAHLHENNQDTLHIHQPGVTWGHFFSNLGFGLGDNYLVDDKGNIYKNDESKKLTFILNGKQVRLISNELINTEDKLLINFGTEAPDSLIETRFKEISSNAGEFNHKNDPASCTGHAGITFKQRIIKSFKP